MDIHIVAPGDTLFAIAARYGVSVSLLAAWNGLRPPYRLAVGQSLGVFFPAETYRVQEGDTLFSISRRFAIPILALLRRNPQLGGDPALVPGQELVLSFESAGSRPLELSGYAYPFAEAQELPSKITATELKHHEAPEDTEASSLLPASEQKKHLFRVLV